LYCPNCGQPVEAGSAFCVKCGSSLQGQPSPQQQPGSVPPKTGTGLEGLFAAATAPVTAPPGVAPEEIGRRIGAFLIDFLIALLAGLLSLIPVVGVVFNLAIVAFWALRDYNGASPGKMVIGSRVISATGGAATVNQLVGRNLIFVVPWIIGLIPFVGFFVAAPLSFIIMIIELALFFTTGRRLGDRLANTLVIKRAA